MTDPNEDYSTMSNGDLAYAVEFAARFPKPLRIEYAKEAAARLRSMEWQPIESAPLDVDILACGGANRLHWGKARRAYAHSNYNGWTPKERLVVTADGCAGQSFSLGEAPTH